MERLYKAQEGQLVTLSNNNVGHKEGGKLFEHIVLVNGMEAFKEEHIVEIHSDDWFALKCIEVPQKIAVRQQTKGTNRHFEKTDLESYLTEEAYKVLVKYDKKKHFHFEAYLRRCLGKKVATFFTDTEIDKITDVETTLMSKNTDEESEGVFEVVEELDIWAELHSEIEVQEILEDLEPEERIIAEKLLDGYNSAEISRELNTYRLKVRRSIERIVAKAGIEKPKERKTKYSNLQATVNKPKNLTSYNKLVKDGKEGNKALGMVTKIWALESKLEKELIKLSELEGETRLKRESTLNTWAEMLEIAKKELEEIENKIK